MGVSFLVLLRARQTPRGGRLWAHRGGGVDLASEGQDRGRSKGLIINRRLVVWSEVRTMAWARARRGTAGYNWGSSRRTAIASRGRVILTVSRKDLMDRQMSLMGFWQEVQRQANRRTFWWMPIDPKRKADPRRVSRKRGTLAEKLAQEGVPRICHPRCRKSRNPVNSCDTETAP